MGLKFKKFTAYIIYPFVWLIFEIFLYLYAIWPSIKEYRFQTKGSISSLKQGFRYIKYYGK